MELKDTLKILRKELGCTQAELANALHVSELSVTRWESGKTAPRTNSAQALLQLAENKGVSKLCRDRLREALQKGREQMLKVPESPLFPVERESICQLVDDCVNAVYVADSKTDELLYVNHMAEKSTGKNFVPGTGQKCYEYIFDRQTPCFQCPKGQMSGDSTIDYQTVSSRSGLRYDVQGRQISWNGKPAHAQYFFVKKPEESAQPLSEIVNHLKIGICTYWVYDDGKIQMNYMSDGYYDLVQSTRKKRERFEGCNVLNAVCDEDRQRVAALVLAASEQRRSFQIRFRVVLDDNSRKQLQMQGTFIRRETGRSVYYCAVGGANECYMSGEE